MSLSKSLYDDLQRFEPLEPDYGEEEEFEGWPSLQEIEDDWFYTSNMSEDDRFPFR